MSTKKSLIILSILAFCSAPSFAQDSQDHDPSDVSKPITSFMVGVTNTGDVKGFGSYAFDVNDSQKGMLLLEGDMSSEGDYKSSRIQYFQAFFTGSPIAPVAAASLDIIDNDAMTSISLGGLVAVTPTEKFSMYLRAGLLGGQYKSDMTDLHGVNDDSATGGTAAAWFTYKTGADGTYVTFHPEYIYVDGDIETETLKTSYRIGTPLNTSQTQWGEFRIDNTSGSVKSTNRTDDIDDT
ncbi:hypothetical protein RCJ22_08500, partial [Vibrio sp. FNV 38]|nr:hypothetical protein [Vibrio sp. FNV 38]